MMDWMDRHCHCAISRSITSIAGSAVTRRATGVSSGILVHQDYRSVWLRNELCASDATTSECRSRWGGLFLIRGANRQFRRKIPLKPLRILADFDPTIPTPPGPGSLFGLIARVGSCVSPQPLLL